MSSATKKSQIEILETRGPDDRGFKRFVETSYTTRVAISFAFISFLTIIVAFGVLSFVWEQHFQAYTHDNMMRIATSTADSVSEALAENDFEWTDDALHPARSASRLNPSVGVQVVDTSGVVRFDNAKTESTHALEIVNSSRAHMVSSPVVLEKVEGVPSTVGYVNVWVYGSDALLTEDDAEFRNRSYGAMLLSMVFAVLISLGVGLMFARNLVSGIKRITDTATAIKNGDEGARTGLSGTDEISRLGETFDAMADSIEKDRQMERRFITDVAHELRTPLMAIQATVEAMVDGVFEPTTERLTTIDTEVQRLSRLVDAQLKLSRLENRKIPVNREKLDLGEVIADVVATHEAYVKDAGLGFTYDKQDDVFVFGDADLLRQATANLISNAVRYTPEGYVSVRVAKGDIMASIQVKDTGIGLSPEEAKKVFDRFWRADAGRNRAQGGLGVGLSVVKEIVDRHNGWVRVEGKKGEGATFTIFIPLYEDRAENAKQGKVKQMTGRLPKVELKPQPKQKAERKQKPKKIKKPKGSQARGQGDGPGA